MAYQAASQFVTLAEAKAIAEKLGFIGGGVKPISDDAETSGIYIPEYSGPFQTPEGGGDRKFYHFRFRNNAAGFNAGLVKRTMEHAPTRWPAMIAAEVDAAASSD